jgi:endonuclease/exonuclease/phosphatase family metal-dependent hydrolase
MKKILTNIGKILVAIILLPILYLVGVLLYAYITDWNPPEVMKIEVRGSAEKDTVNKNELVFMTWNFGYGGLGKECDFFYDGGKMSISDKNIVEKNVQGFYQTLQERIDTLDFALIQEIDSQGKRSHYINEIKDLSNALSSFSYCFAKNYDVKFVPEPYTKPLGDVVGGLVSYNRWKPSDATRYSLKAYPTFPTYLFYLDRCFLVERFPLKNKKELIVINTHNSAYDPKGDMKKMELAQIQEVLNAEYKKGNYVIMGGDWNQYPPDFKGIKGFAPNHPNPANWVPKNYPAEGWQWAYQTEIPTNRSLLTVFDATTTYQTVIDYFLVSPNVEVKYVKAVDTGFDFSDHQPVMMKVKLKE